MTSSWKQSLSPFDKPTSTFPQMPRPPMPIVVETNTIALQQRCMVIHADLESFQSTEWQCPSMKEMFTYQYQMITICPDLKCSYDTITWIAKFSYFVHTDPTFSSRTQRLVWRQAVYVDDIFDNSCIFYLLQKFYMKCWILSINHILAVFCDLVSEKDCADMND